jgi:hypothetical protein
MKEFKLKSFARYLPTLIIVVMVGILPLTALAAQPANPGGNCDPGLTKVDTNDGSIFIEAGVEVCIKAGDGNTGKMISQGETLEELILRSGLLNNGGQVPNVSNYVTYTTTTTTSIPKETTTTVRETTTTTEEGTTTTHGETSTTVPNEEETTSSVPPSTTTLPSPTEEVVEEEPAALPFTGLGGLVPLSGLALALLASGGLVLRREIR